MATKNQQPYTLQIIRGNEVCVATDHPDNPLFAFSVMRDSCPPGQILGQFKNMAETVTWLQENGFKRLRPHFKFLWTYKSRCTKNVPCLKIGDRIYSEVLIEIAEIKTLEKIEVYFPRHLSP